MFSPSIPERFVETPLSLEHAFGGVAVVDDDKHEFSDNPKGKGFILTESGAAGSPLPNLEDPAKLIERWDDRPDICGFGLCPITCSARIFPGVEAE